MRRVKGFFVFILILVLLAAGGVVFLRVNRSRVADAKVVKPNLVAVENGSMVFVYAAKVGPHVILFDTGVDPEGHPIDKAVTALQAGRGDVSDVFLSHGHIDHTAGAALLPKAKLYLGAGDVPLAEGKAPPEALMGKIFNAILPVPPFSVSNPLTGAASIDVGDGKTVKAFPVPGHTAGSYAYLYDGVLFPGDIMAFKQGQLEPTPKAFDTHPEENKAAIKSLKTQLASETVEIVCTAHGGCTPKGLGRTLLDELISRL
jgi:glyoxylase-like metal-dependent hydrolase (beta-lactamase superfamily II)